MKSLLSYLPIQQDLGLFILRVAAGGMMLYGHGWNKLMGFVEMKGQFPDPLGIGSTGSLSLTIFGEVFCSALLILGLWTRVAVVPLIIMGIVMAFVIHGSDPFGKKELALIYLIMYIVIFLLGPGKYSIDGMRKK